MKLLKIILPLFIMAYVYNSTADEKFVLPIKCELGKTCWISNLPRHKYKGLELDFRCGPKTYNDHKGTDFALKDIKQMEEGVDVLAPFDGVVKSKRDEMKDIDIRQVLNKTTVKGKECGNGVVILNSEKIEAQLCHLKLNSLKVKVGDHVKAGDVIGEVGMSGLSEYPHLHISFRDQSKDISIELDPFYGAKQGCGLKPKSLWRDAELLDKNARTGVIYNYGFAFNNISTEQVLYGNYNTIQPEFPTEFVGFVDIFSVNKGDKITITIVDNKNQVFVKREHKFAKYQARYFLYVGKNLHQTRISGEYKLMINYLHFDDEKQENYSSTIKL